MEPANTQLEPAPCPAGCPPGESFVLVGRDRLHDLPGEFTVVRCDSCGLMRTDPRPTQEALARFYPDDYGPYLGTRIQAESTRPTWRRRLGRFVQRITPTNADRLPQVPPGRLLEIGCASGSYLHRMSTDGWDVTGIEYSERAAASARAAGYLVHAGPLESASDPSEPFDLIVGWMVLEHLRDPVFALRKLHGWSRPGAWLVASVPNADSWEFRIFSKFWYALHLPNHLWHPGHNTIGPILEKGGWRLERVFFHRDLRNVLGSLGNALEEREWMPWLSEWLRRFPERGGRVVEGLYPASFLLAALRLTGRMTIWARRIDD